MCVVSFLFFLFLRRRESTSVLCSLFLLKEKRKGSLVTSVFFFW